MADVSSTLATSSLYLAVALSSGDDAASILACSSSAARTLLSRKLSRAPPPPAAPPFSTSASSAEGSEGPQSDVSAWTRDCTMLTRICVRSIDTERQ